MPAASERDSALKGGSTVGACLDSLDTRDRFHAPRVHVTFGILGRQRLPKEWRVCILAREPFEEPLISEGLRPLPPAPRAEPSRGYAAVIMSEAGAAEC